MESPAGLASDQIDAAAADADTITKVQLYAIEALPFDIGQKWRHEVRDPYPLESRRLTLSRSTWS